MVLSAAPPAEKMAQTRPRFVLQTDLHEPDSDLFPALLLGNARRLSRSGVIVANTALRPLFQAHRRLVWNLYQHCSEARLTELKADLARRNAEAMAHAAEVGAHTVVLCHNYALGYPPYADLPDAPQSGGFYPHAETLLQAMLAGLPEESVTLLIHSRPAQDAIPTLYAVAARKLEIATDLDGFVDRLDLDALSLPGLLGRLKAAVPDALFRLRETKESDDDREVAATFLRDIGSDPLRMSIAPPPRPPMPGRAQLAQLTAIAGAKQTGSLSAEDAHRQAAGVLTPPGGGKGDGSKPEMSAGNSAKLAEKARAATAFLAAGTPPLTIFFIVEPGPLELQAHLLVASLMVNGRDDFRMTAFCRDDRIDRLHPETVSFLRDCGVRIEPLHNDFPDGYPAGNKLIAAGQVEAPGWAVFLDTDMILARPSRFMDEAVPGMVSACLESVNGWSNDPEDWAALFKAVKQPRPDRQVQLLEGEVSFPLYNAGFLMFQRTEGADDFGRLWLNSARWIDADPRVPNKRPWLDTVALPVALARPEGAIIRLLAPQWNCTTRLADSSVRILHYHGVRQLHIYGWEQQVDAILAASPSPHNTLAEAIAYHKNVMALDGDIMRRAMRHGHMS